MEDRTRVTVDWNQLHNYYYQKKEIYAYDWDVDLNQHVVAGAPFGGALALLRDDHKLVDVSHQQLRPTLKIYSTSGKMISQTEWLAGKLIQMGWTSKENLVCVLDDGTILVFSVHGELLKQFRVEAISNQKVADCKIWSNGVVIMTNYLQLYAIYNPEGKHAVHQLANSGFEEPPMCWTIIEPQFTMSQTVEVLLANKIGSVVVVSADKAEDQRLTFNKPFTKMSVSPTGKIIACYTQTGDLIVLSTDFSKNLSEFNVKSKVPPQQLVWCGTDSVVLYWDSILLMVGPYGSWIKYSFEEPLYLVPECDGVRVILNSRCEFISRVPDVIEGIFKVGSMAPAATLYDAMENFEQKLPKADENIRSIKNELKDAVDDCILAAAHELNPMFQKSLLKAASFGKCFLDSYDPDNFVRMTRTLRVLNAIRIPRVGIPLTITQYQTFKIENLLDRLATRHHHYLAYKICEYLKIKPDRVLVHWACAKVKTRADDVEISNLIVKKFSGLASVSYADIAQTALQYNRQQLALMLLEYEPRASSQVPLLISMGQDELALNKAIESGDTDLVYMVLLHIKKTRTLAEFFRIVRNKPFAVDLFISYCKQQELDLLIQIYHSLGQFGDIGNIRVLQAYQQTRFDDKLAELEHAYESFKEGKDQFAQKVTEDQIKLLLIQQDLEKEFNQEFVDLSISETLKRLIDLKEGKRVAKLRSDFKVPDKRFWWIKIKALAAKKDWEELLRFAKEKKSPIGYKPFADVCLEQNAIKDAATYISMIAEPAVRVEYYQKIGYYEEAAEIAIRELKDNALVEQIRAKAVASRGRK